jgi:hypothetical protein
MQWTFAVNYGRILTAYDTRSVSVFKVARHERKTRKHARREQAVRNVDQNFWHLIIPRPGAPPQTL